MGPDKNINWKAAQKWAAGIKVGGGGWRLPNAEELQSIHDQKAEGDKKLSPLLATTGSWVWLSYAHLTQGFWQRAGYFGGKFKVKQYYDSDSNYKRAFAVRRKK